MTFLDFLAEQMLQAELQLYLNQQLGFTSTDQSELVVVTVAASLIGLLFVMRPLASCLSANGALRVALLANAVSIGLYSAVNRKWQAKSLAGGTLLGVGVFPTTLAIAASSVSAPGNCRRGHDVGVAQGVVSAARVLAEGVSPLAFGAFIQATEHSRWPGVPFAVAGGCVALAVLVSAVLPRQP